MERNNFGFVRLVLAFSVLVSHAAELTDGSRNREILAMAFGYRTLGEVAVNGFFLVSGFLVTFSLVNSKTVTAYFTKRMLRIYPAFIVAFAISAFIVAPLFGGALTPDSIAYNLMRVAKLDVPLVTGAFGNLPVPTLNGSMWTISFEFRCYIIIAALSLFDLYRIRAFILGSGAILLIASGFDVAYDWNLSAGTPHVLMPITGNPDFLLRLVGIFLIGSSYFLYRDTLKFNAWVSVAAFALTLVALPSRFWCDIISSIAGGYAVFWFIFSPRFAALNKIGTRTDISYGLYLYAWPVQQIILSFNPQFPLAASLMLTTAISAALALVSWNCLEKPCLTLKNQIGAQAQLLVARCLG